MIIIMKLLCFLYGHKWRDTGWTNHSFDKSVPEGSVANLFICTKCKIITRVYETGDCLQKRFDGYKAKYGEQIVSTCEFSAPQPQVSSKQPKAR